MNKFPTIISYIVVLLALTHVQVYASSKDMVTVRVNKSKQLLSKVRGNDFTHPGGQEAIQLVINAVIQATPNISNKNTLDVGCGFGGTTHFINNSGFKRIWGVDINECAKESA